MYLGHREQILNLIRPAAAEAGPSVSGIYVLTSSWDKSIPERKQASLASVKRKGKVKLVS